MAEMKSVGRVFGANDEVTSEVATDHHIELSQKGGEWFVVSDSYLDWFNQKLAPDHATPRAAPAAPAPSQQSGVHVEPETAPSGNSMTYNRIAALTYADMYATSYNPNYYNYNPDGGDCANFVSQALYDPVYGANLPREDPNWYYLYGQSGAAASPIAWRYTPSQHQFLINNPYGSYYDFGYFGTSGSWSATNAYDKSYMLTGDIHFYDWYSDGLIRHATIAVGYLGDGTTLIDSHNLDRKRVRYDFDASYDNGTTYYMDRINHTINY
jgi:hypothetical protein